jgi:hypothetical protein
MHENREAENILSVSTDFALNLPARKMCLGIKLVSSDTPRSLRCIRIRSLSFIETHIVLPVTRTLAMDHKNDERRKGGRDEEGRTWTIVMTLSSPALNAPLGKMNLSSVSSRMLLLFVELQTVVNGKIIIRRWRISTHFPKLVPKNTSFNQTLAANAEERGASVMKKIGRKWETNTPSPPLIERLTLFSSPVAVKCPLQRTMFSQLGPREGRV